MIGIAKFLSIPSPLQSPRLLIYTYAQHKIELFITAHMSVCANHIIKPPSYFFFFCFLIMEAASGLCAEGEEDIHKHYGIGALSQAKIHGSFEMALDLLLLLLLLVKFLLLLLLQDLATCDWGVWVAIRE